jgi:hypothetical protein
MIARLFRDAPALAGIVVCLLAALGGWCVRYWFYEPDIFGAICYAENPWWCIFRTIIAVETRNFGTGWTSLGLAAIALIRIARGRSGTGFAYAALVVGGIGLILYDTTLSAPAVLIALLSLVRAPERGKKAA